MLHFNAIAKIDILYGIDPSESFYVADWNVMLVSSTAFKRGFNCGWQKGTNLVAYHSCLLAHFDTKQSRFIEHIYRENARFWVYPTTTYRLSKLWRFVVKIRRLSKASIVWACTCYCYLSVYIMRFLAWESFIASWPHPWRTFYCNSFYMDSLKASSTTAVCNVQDG